LAPEHKNLHAGAYRGRCRSSEGFTVIELMVAVTVLAVGILSLVSVFDSSRRLVSVSERKEAAVHQAEREMERILSLDYEAVALDEVPDASDDEDDPGYYVEPGPPASYQWDQGDTGPRSDELVVDEATGTLAPESDWADSQGRIQGSLHRFVTWIDDPCCPGTEDAKRVTLAVTVDGGERQERPLLISSIVSKPEGD
jgi:prepilin-type N-terminal cleavage/methylation domain-containing protein